MREKIYQIGNEYATIEEFFTMARNNYIEDPRDLNQICAILNYRRMRKKAEYVSFIKYDIIEKRAFEESHLDCDGARFCSVNQIKRDYIDYEGKKSTEKNCFFENGDYRVDICCIFENGKITTVIEIANYETGSQQNTRFTLSWEEFKLLSQKDFEYQINEAVFYHNPDEFEVA
jgi:hypothetical protein